MQATPEAARSESHTRDDPFSISDSTLIRPLDANDTQSRHSQSECIAQASPALLLTEVEAQFENEAGQKPACIAEDENTESWDCISNYNIRSSGPTGAVTFQADTSG